MSRRQPEPYLKIKNVTEYVTNSNKRMFTPFRVKPDGSMFYIVDGEEVPKDEFEKQYPVRIIPTKALNNIDKRQHWLHDEQSY